LPGYLYLLVLDVDQIPPVVARFVHQARDLPVLLNDLGPDARRSPWTSEPISALDGTGIERAIPTGPLGGTPMPSAEDIDPPCPIGRGAE